MIRVFLAGGGEFLADGSAQNDARAPFDGELVPLGMAFVRPGSVEAIAPAPMGPAVLAELVNQLSEEDRVVFLYLLDEEEDEDEEVAPDASSSGSAFAALGL